MNTNNVNVHSVKSARKGAKFLAPLTVLTTFIFLFLVMGVDVFTLKAVAEPVESIWWYLFWGAAIGLFLFSLCGAIGLVFALFSAAIATIVDKHRKKAYAVMIGVLLTGVASFLIRSAKSEDLRALEARAVAFHDPVFQEKVQSKNNLQAEMYRLNNDKDKSNDHLIAPLQEQVNGIDNELASLSDKYSGEARLADAAIWLIVLSSIVSVIIDFAYTYCVQKGWGYGHYARVVIEQEEYDNESKQQEELKSVKVSQNGGNGQFETLPENRNSSEPRNLELSPTPIEVKETFIQPVGFTEPGYTAQDNTEQAKTEPEVIENHTHTRERYYLTDEDRKKAEAWKESRRNYIKGLIAEYCKENPGHGGRKIAEFVNKQLENVPLKSRRGKRLKNKITHTTALKIKKELEEEKAV